MILLHNGNDLDDTNASRAAGHIIKVESLTITLSKTPIQIPLPSASPQLLDLNMIRSSITIGGLVENTVPIGDDYTLAATATTDGDLDGNPSGTPVQANVEALFHHGLYTHPDKAALEFYFTTEAYLPDNEMALIIIDPSGTSYSFYNISGQSATFILAPGTEDRYSYNLVWAGGLRNQLAGS
jgi:hypothetical protein